MEFVIVVLNFLIRPEFRNWFWMRRLFHLEIVILIPNNYKLHLVNREIICEFETFI